MVQKKSIEERTLVEILEEAIQKEQNAHSYYLEASKHAGMPAAKRLLSSLAEFEKGHAENLTKYLENLRIQMEIDRAFDGSFILPEIPKD